MKQRNAHLLPFCLAQVPQREAAIEERSALLAQFVEDAAVMSKHAIVRELDWIPTAGN